MLVICRFIVIFPFLPGGVKLPTLFIEQLTALTKIYIRPLHENVLFFQFAEMKRKTDDTSSTGANGLPESKKRALSSEEATARFRDGLFDSAEQQKYTDAYAKSTPYVIPSHTLDRYILINRGR